MSPWLSAARVGRCQAASPSERRPAVDAGLGALPAGDRSSPTQQAVAQRRRSAPRPGNARAGPGWQSLRARACSRAELGAGGPDRGEVVGRRDDRPATMRLEEDHPTAARSPVLDERARWPSRRRPGAGPGCRDARLRRRRASRSATAREPGRTRVRREAILTISSGDPSARTQTMALWSLRTTRSHRGRAEAPALGERRGDPGLGGRAAWRARSDRLAPPPGLVSSHSIDRPGREHPGRRRRRGHAAPCRATRAARW